MKKQWNVYNEKFQIFVSVICEMAQVNYIMMCRKFYCFCARFWRQATLGEFGCVHNHVCFGLLFAYFDGILEWAAAVTHLP